MASPNYARECVGIARQLQPRRISHVIQQLLGRCRCRVSASGSERETRQRDKNSKSSETCFAPLAQSIIPVATTLGSKSFIPILFAHSPSSFVAVCHYREKSGIITERPEQPLEQLRRAQPQQARVYIILTVCLSKWPILSLKLAISNKKLQISPRVSRMVPILLPHIQTLNYLLA